MKLKKINKYSIYTKINAFLVLYNILIIKTKYHMIDIYAAAIEPFEPISVYTSLIFFLTNKSRALFLARWL